MTVFMKIFDSFEKVESPTFNQIKFYINGNFNKVIKLLIAIYGRHCVVCDYASPSFRMDSGVADHYYSRHRDDTIEFVKNHLLIKTEDELERMIQ